MFRISLLAALFALPVYAQESIVVNSGETQTAVVELYTSEGCNSCPPADKWLNRLSQAPSDELDVLPLAFHVDYWNYLGWKDRFSDPRYTSRQRQLGANNLQRTIYTPEFFVNGKESRGAGTILDNIEQSNRQIAPLELNLTVTRSGDDLLLEVVSPANRNTIGPVHHRYIVYENNLSTDVKRGENSGRTLHHQQVVRYMSPALILDDKNRYKIMLDPDWKRENIGVAVVATAPGNVHYLQAVHTPVGGLLAP